MKLPARVRRRIVPNWKSRLHDWSTWALGLVTVASGGIAAAWALMPQEWRDGFPKEWIPYIAGGYLAIGALGGVSKFIVQKPRGEK